MREPPMKPGHQRLAEQFDRQATEAREIADLVDSADSISLEVQDV